MSGLEFIVSYDPLQAAAQSDNRFAHEPSNVWVVRKQNRRKRSGMDDEVTVISTYFVVGDCIYMAPSVASVVGNRIVRLILCVLGSGSELNGTNANSSFLTAVSRHLSISTHEDCINATKFHTILRTHLYAT